MHHVGIGHISHLGGHAGSLCQLHPVGLHEGSRIGRDAYGRGHESGRVDVENGMQTAFTAQKLQFPFLECNGICVPSRTPVQIVAESGAEAQAVAPRCFDCQRFRAQIVTEVVDGFEPYHHRVAGRAEADCPAGIPHLAMARVVSRGCVVVQIAGPEIKGEIRSGQLEFILRIGIVAVDHKPRSVGVTVTSESAHGVEIERMARGRIDHTRHGRYNADYAENGDYRAYDLVDKPHAAQVEM